MPKAIRIELINCHHNDPLASYFGIKKTHKLLAWKYHWPTLWHNVKAYVKGCDMCLALKVVKRKSYDNLLSLPILTHQWKNLLLDFMTGLTISTDWKRDNYDFILIIVNRLIKMVHHKLVKITIDAPGLAEVIIDVVVRHHGLLNLIVTNRGSFFTSKFWSSFCYFLGIKERLSTTFHP